MKSISGIYSITCYKIVNVNELIKFKEGKSDENFSACMALL